MCSLPIHVRDWSTNGSVSVVGRAGNSCTTAGRSQPVAKVQIWAIHHASMPKFRLLAVWAFIFGVFALLKNASLDARLNIGGGAGDCKGHPHIPPEATNKAHHAFRFLRLQTRTISPPSYCFLDQTNHDEPHGYCRRHPCSCRLQNIYHRWCLYSAPITTIKGCVRTKTHRNSTKTHVCAERSHATFATNLQIFPP